MSDGKYRWMTPEEAEREIGRNEWVWICLKRYGNRRKCIEHSEAWVNVRPEDRICRALVPEPPGDET